VGLGNLPEARDAVARAAFAKFPPGAISADEARGLTLFSEADALEKGDALISLPLILDDNNLPPAAKESRAMRLRAALCVTPSGHAIIAMATSHSDEAAALALGRVGCARAVALDRGAHRPTFFHRAGAGSPPLARYDESVLYAISRPMAPRAYRWNPPSPSP
jgi:hypothetical protein